jgi:nucleotide-binding universal stress UspA family protein
MQAPQNLFVAGIDFWNPSLNALGVAARFATQFNGRVLAVHIIEKQHQYPDELAIDSDTMEEDLQNALHNLVQPLSDSGIPVEIEIRRGDMLRQMSQLLHDHEAKAVFLGLRKGKVLEDIFIGSNTLHMLKHAEVPVVVVESAPDSASITELVIPWNRSIGLKKAVGFLRSLHSQMNASALLITGILPGETEDEVHAAANLLADDLLPMGVSEVELEIVECEDLYTGILTQIKMESGEKGVVLLEQPDFASAGQFTLGSFVEDVLTRGRMPVVCLPISR